MWVKGKELPCGRQQDRERRGSLRGRPAPGCHVEESGLRQCSTDSDELAGGVSLRNFAIPALCVFPFLHFGLLNPSPGK